VKNIILSDNTRKLWW